jgi:hypothetical protein
MHLSLFSLLLHIHINLLLFEGAQQRAAGDVAPLIVEYVIGSRQTEYAWSALTVGERGNLFKFSWLTGQYRIVCGNLRSKRLRDHG